MSHTGLDIRERADDPSAQPPMAPAPAHEAEPTTRPVFDVPTADVDRITRSKRRAAWALFIGALVFLAVNIVVQLIQCIRIGTGVGIGDGMAASDGRAQTLVPQAIAGYNEAHTADNVVHEAGLMLVWFVGCMLLVWGYYALLSRLRAV